MNKDGEITREELLERRKWFCLFFDKCKVFEQITDEQAGRLIKAICKYAEHGELTETDDPMVNVLLTVFQADLDAGTEKFIKDRMQKINASHKRWEKEKNDATASDRIRPNTNKEKDIEKDTEKEKDIEKNAASDEADARRNMDSLTSLSSLSSALARYYNRESKPSSTAAYRILSYYLEKYNEKQGQEHPPISAEVYRGTIFPELKEIRNNSGDRMFDAEKHEDEETVELYKQIIDKHFATDYGNKCDYSMIHFFSGNIRANRLNEIKNGRI